MVPSRPDFITIVSGLPRSGTSMMMQMLDAGGLSALTDQVRAADESNPRGYFELEAVKNTREDASWVDAASGKCVKVIFLLLNALPSEYSYRVVFMRRNIASVVASQQTLLAQKGTPGGGLPPGQLAQVYTRELDKVSQWLADQSNFNVCWIDYEAVIDGSVEVVARIVDFLGGGLDVDAMRKAVEPGLRHKRT